MSESVSKRTPWAVRLVAFAAAAAALLAQASLQRKSDEQVARKVASLADSVARLQQERPPERVIERHTTREVVRADSPPPGAPPAERDEPAETRGPFDANDVREYSAGRGPHPIERLFERERGAQTREVVARQRALEALVEQASSEGTDVDVQSVECSPSTCRIEATFGSVESSNRFAGRIFTPGAGGHLPFEHGGMYAPVHEDAGDRHHSVFYALKRQSDG